MLAILLGDEPNPQLPKQRLVRTRAALPSHAERICLCTCISLINLRWAKGDLRDMGWK